MAGVRGWEDLRAKAAKSELAKLGETICQQYGTDLQDWLDIATTPLPEKFLIEFRCLCFTSFDIS